MHEHRRRPVAAAIAIDVQAGDFMGVEAF